MKRKREGSTLIGLMIVIVPLGLVLSSVIIWQMSESRINHRNLLRHEALNAAESIIEYSFADLSKRFDQESSFPPGDLAPSADPLTVPDSVKTGFFGGTNIDPDTIEVRGGTIPPGTTRFISADDEAYDQTVFSGTWAHIREVKVYAKAAAVSPSGKFSSTAYIEHALEVIDSPLFSHAVFYNHDLEYFPAPDMFMNGPIHANGSAYLKPSKKLQFEDKITLTGEFYMKSKEVKSSGAEKNWSKGTGKVKFMGVDVVKDGTVIDSRDEDWAELSVDYFNEAIQDSTHDVPVLNPVGIPDYVPDDPLTAADETINSGYSLIEPVLPKILADGITANPDYKGDAVREQKFAYKAGLILRVEANPDHTSLGGTDTASNHDLIVKAYKYTRTDATDPLSDPVEDANGDLILTPVTLPPGAVGDVNATFDGMDEDGYYEEFAVDGSNDVIGGLDDPRQRDDPAGYDSEIDLFTIDLSVLADKINNKDNTATGFDGTYDVDNDWNGVVYVEFPTSTTVDSTTGIFEDGDSGNRPDQIVAGVYQTLALQVIQAQTIPNPAGASEEGFTLASNGPIYTVGHFNADGTISDDSDHAADPGEAPVLVAADSVTPLSPNWPNTRKNSNKGRDTREAADLEFAGAIISGTPPTDATGTVAISGGVQNFIRKFETWQKSNSNSNWLGSKNQYTTTYRGSIVSVFEPEVHLARFKGGFARPPIRDFGFSDVFGEERRFPPGTPNVRESLRGKFRLLTQTEYDAAIANLNTLYP